MYLLANLAKEDVGSTVLKLMLGVNPTPTSICYADSTRPRAKALGEGIHRRFTQHLKGCFFISLLLKINLTFSIEKDIIVLY